MEKYNVPIVKHLEDQDDLSQGRDAELVLGQETLAEEMATTIYEHAIANNFTVLVFCISPKKRSRQTAGMVETILKEKPIKLRIISEVDDNLREVDQGKFILPENYAAGESFPGLKVAGKIFSSETFNSEDPTKDNLDYHFGDPMAGIDGVCKYPELKDYFLEPGESYREVLLRFYSRVVELSKNLERFNDKVEPVIFTHGQPHQIFKNLSEVAEKIENENFTFEAGQLPRICWDLYQKKRQGVIPFGKIDFVSIEHVCKPRMIELLEREIAYLQENQLSIPNNLS